MSKLQSQVPVEVVGDLRDGDEGLHGVNASGNENLGAERKKVVVVGLGMVGIAFM